MKYQYVSFRKALVRADQNNIVAFSSILKAWFVQYTFQSETDQEIPKMGISKV